MKFKKYQHIERFGTIEVEGIEFGTCYVFPKIDGTNGSAWYDDEGCVRYGSRNRALDADNDNTEFLTTMSNSPMGNRVANLCENHIDLRLFGEWLVPHSLKTYRDDAWRKFYVFDVVRDLPEELPSGEKFEYLTYEEYKPLMEKFGIDYIPCVAKYENGTYEAFLKNLKGNNFLIEDGRGDGEGIVIKNYQYKNRFGRTTWAKIVASDFQEKHNKEMGIAIEEHIIENFCTTALITKTHAKIVTECNGWSSKFIPRLLNTVYHDLVTEECWSFVKKFKNPIVNFKRLQRLVTQKTKETLPELF